MTDDQIVEAAIAILDRRMKTRSQPIGAPGEAVMAAALELSEERTETLMAIWLKDSDKVINRERIGHGGVDMVSFVPRELARAAVLNDALGAILVHNHPPGDPTPSTQDKEASQRLQNCLAAVGVLLVGSFTVANGQAACCLTGRVFDLAGPTGEGHEPT